MRVTATAMCFALACTTAAELVETVPEPAGPHCANGGIAVQTGTDDNGDGSLQAAEVEEVNYVCNGDPTSTALVDIVPEPAGLNCARGGTAVRTGLDRNANDTLDDAEVQHTAYVCNGADGTSQLVITMPEPAGSHCPAGGIAILVGTDVDANGMLSTDEVSSTSYVCNGG